MPSVNDPRHAAVLAEAQGILRASGCLLADAGYEHVYSGEFKTALSQCDSVPAHLIRTRSDRIALLENRLLWYDAKTTAWKKGQDFPIEAMPFLKACSDAKTFGIEYLFCCQRNDGTGYGLFAGESAASLVQRLLVPEWRRGDDVERWRTAFQPLLDSLGSSSPIFSGNCSRGGGDAFVALAIDSSPMPSWKDAIQQWIHDNLSGNAIPPRDGPRRKHSPS